MNDDLQRIQDKYKDILLAPVDELPFTIRTSNCLAAENIVHVGDLVQRSDKELLRITNLGKKSLQEIEAILAEYNLKLETKVKDWPPEELEPSHVHEDVMQSVKHSLNYALRVAADKVHQNCVSNDPDRAIAYSQIVTDILWLLNEKEKP